ncbi:MAG: hypothetical protein V2J12_12365, partial [Gammaproteobacteria bacterium]|nr:hypothetical protein [Gammaproteobacteria bacterium]
MTATAGKPQLHLLEVTRAEYQSGHAFDTWEGDDTFGRIGGEFAALLCSSPVREHRDDDPLLLTAMIGTRPVGCITTFNGLLHVGDHAVPMLWCSGLSVLPEHRNTGAGLMILLQLRARPIASGAVGVSKAALPIYRQLGWCDLAADRHLLVRRSAPILRGLLRTPWLSLPASWLADAVLGLQRLALTAWLKFRFRGFRVEEVAELPVELDRSIGALQRPVKCHRSTTLV